MINLNDSAVFQKMVAQILPALGALGYRSNPSVGDGHSSFNCIVFQMHHNCNVSARVMANVVKAAGPECEDVVLRCSETHKTRLVVSFRDTRFNGRRY